MERRWVWRRRRARERQGGRPARRQLGWHTQRRQESMKSTSKKQRQRGRDRESRKRHGWRAGDADLRGGRETAESARCTAANKVREQES
eukprot:4171774-Pleurochrysis_carterae.AAC.2